ncbi:MAG: DUF996 domain-containing protein [Nitrososphaerota archaeon]|jgi:uncharacterized membrane protein|nr:DUF996 domain-containing protein [Nitrososphaerota archaeon]
MSQAKTFGEVGSILVLLGFIPAAGPVVAIIGFVLILIAVKYISDSLQDSAVFSNILIAIVLAIIGVAGGGVVVAASFFRFMRVNNFTFGAIHNVTGTTTGIFALAGGVILGLAIIWVLFVVAAYFQRKSYDVIATRLKVDMFRTAAFVYLIGAALVIIGVGLLLLLIAQILFAIAFFSIKETQTAQPSGSSPAPPSAQPGTKFCSKCGASMPQASMYCPGCGVAQPAST